MSERDECPPSLVGDPTPTTGDGNVLYRDCPLPRAAFTRAVTLASDLIRNRRDQVAPAERPCRAILPPIGPDPRLE